ncbi:MAG: ABC transporter substrate-binding protein [Gammaproteobacteria bacterium]|nr:ABC transporter substrate-binding protein [Gammaproteobacteria bacterium]
MSSFRLVFVILLGLLLLAVVAPAQAGFGMALGYTPKYGEGFSHFDYVNPEAPRGGRLNLAQIGSFDSLNPFPLRGQAAAGLNQLMFESLMESSLDEPFSQYGLLAERGELAEDGLSVSFWLNPAARFHDGSPVLAEDVKVSFDTLREHGHPWYRIYWGDIARAVVVDERVIRFEFARVNPELHLLVGQVPVFSRRWVDGENFDRLALKEPITSGPYRVEHYDLGKRITYVRNPDYWGKDLPVRRGQYNFERITYKYYRDFVVAMEAFKAGEFDFNMEYNSKRWARDYIGSPFRSGRILRDELPHSNNAGMQGFVFNQRRPLFQDIRVRQALGLALDFEWSNRNLFYDQYEYNDSYFANSELAAQGLPEGEELALLAPFRGQLPGAVFEQPTPLVSTAPPGSLRENLRQARDLLAEAGWTYRDGALRNARGEPFRIHIMLVQRAFERIVAPYARNLAVLGIQVDYRTVDPALYQRRMDNFDFDMVVAGYNQTQSPGNELMGMFHSSSADEPGSRNLMGLKDPVLDALIEQVIYAVDRESLVTAARALDRVLMHGHHIVPQWYIATHRVAWWDKFERPETLPLYYQAVSWMIATWWAKED